MFVSQLSILNFKNYEEASLKLHEKLNCFVGDNGEGKTNLLDAIYYLCMCKSFFNSNDTYNVRQGEDYLMLNAIFDHQGQQDEIHCGLKLGKKKQFRRNKKEYGRLADHIGLFPVVMVSPADSALITESSDERRKYINGVISQYDKAYLESTIKYNKLLQQRNKLLKESSFNKDISDLLEVFDSQMAPLASFIHDVRKKFTEDLGPIFQEYYEIISDGKEQVEIEYSSHLNEGDYESLLKESLQKDRIIKHTSKGIHKDDLVLKLKGMNLKRTGSQGQQKTFLVALKMAQFIFLNKEKGLKPILLLDDIFDKFDVHRVRKILELVSSSNFGQIFITHTNQARMQELLSAYEGGYNIYQVQNGQINQLTNA